MIIFDSTFFFGTLFFLIAFQEEFYFIKVYTTDKLSFIAREIEYKLVEAKAKETYAPFVST
jgi:hypothetical protein